MLAGDSNVLLSDLTWPEIAAMRKDGTLVVIPTGSTEQHGWHLPLGTDSFLAFEVARSAVLQIRETVPVLLTPPLTVGLSSAHKQFPGSLSLSATTYIAMVTELALGLVQQGFQRLVFINGHAGNYEPLKLAVRSIREKYEVLVAMANYWTLAREDFVAIAQNDQLSIGHGGELETALMLHLYPTRVRMECAHKADHSLANPYIQSSLLCEPKATFGFLRTDLSRIGNTDDPTQASVETGRRFFNAAVSAVAEFLRFVHASPLPTHRLPQEPEKTTKNIHPQE